MRSLGALPQAMRGDEGKGKVGGSSPKVTFRKCKTGSGWIIFHGEKKLADEAETKGAAAPEWYAQREKQLDAQELEQTAAGDGDGEGLDGSQTGDGDGDGKGLDGSQTGGGDGDAGGGKGFDGSQTAMNNPWRLLATEDESVEDAKPGGHGGIECKTMWPHIPQSWQAHRDI